MVEVQLKGFPKWTEAGDLKYTVDQCGFPTLGLRFVNNNDLAEIKLPTWEAADEVVNKLHKYEFTPGYPLQARIKPGQVRPVGKAGGQLSKVVASKPADTRVKSYLEIPPTDPKFSVMNCIGAGRIEGWFLNSKTNALQRGWGHVQSYCYEGNLLFRPVNSPVLKDADFNQKDPVTFEVMLVKGEPEAVRLATPELEGEPQDHPIQSGPDPKTGATSAPFEGKDEDGERDGDGFLIASLKSQRRRQREESDGRVLFFGGFGFEISESTLTKFAEQAGEVVKVKLFLNTITWQSKGCAKIQYVTQEGADKAMNELAGTVLNERIVTVEPLGQSSNPNPNPKRHRGGAPPKPRDDYTDDMPKQLPLSLFSPTDTPQAKLQICYAAFEDLLNNHNPEVTGVSLILMIRKLVMEVNDIFGEDEASLQAFCQHLKQYSWFRENSQIVKWQASKKRVNISKASEATPIYISHQQAQKAAVDQRKLEQQIMGKAVFEVPEEEKRLAPKAPPERTWDKGKGKGKGGGGWNY
jgi:hypothetical protein